MEDSNNKKTNDYQLTDAERTAVLGIANNLAAAKLGVYAANVALEDAKARVAAACRKTDEAETQFAATINFLAQSHGITTWRIAPDFTRIEEVKQ